MTRLSETGYSPVRGLTVRQPWAWAIAHGGKHVENRTGGPERWRHRGSLLIHAGDGWSSRGAADERVLSAWVQGATHGIVAPLPKPKRVGGRPVHESLRSYRPADRIVFGAVVAVAELTDVHPAAGCCKPWGEDRYEDANGRLRTDVVHLVLEAVEVLPDDGVPAMGRLGLWKPDTELLADVLDELRGQR